MSKFLVIPSNSKDLELDADGFILGVDNLSVNVPKTFDIDTIIEFVLKNPNKDIFVSLNKNMHNSDLEHLKKIMLKLNNIDIKGVLYYDMAVVNLYKKLNLKYDLVWSQEHSTTNYFTCEYWHSKGVNYTYLSGEITVEEIKDIKSQTNMKMLLNIFGYLPMFVSKRPLVQNYLKTFKLKDNSKIHYLKDKNNLYPLTYNNSTCLYSNYVLNGIEEIKQLEEIEYFVLNTLLIDDFDKVLEAFKNNDSTYINKKYNNKGFLYKETIYKVKK